MARYLIADDSGRIVYEAEAKSITDGIAAFLPDSSESDGLSFDVYRIADGPKRVSIQHETVRKVVIE